MRKNIWFKTNVYINENYSIKRKVVKGKRAATQIMFYIWPGTTILRICVLLV
jgi:hypothetical protein